MRADCWARSRSRCHAHHLNNRYTLSISLDRVFNPDRLPVVKATVGAFLKHSLAHAYDNFWPLPFWIILIFVWVNWLRKFEDRNSSIRWINHWLMFSFAGYALLLLFLYLTTFPDYDAIKVASYERYLKPFMMGMVVFWFAVSLNHIAILKMPKRFAYVLIGALMIGSTSRAWTFPFSTVSKPHATATAIQEDLFRLKELAPSLGRKRIWVIRTPSQELEASIFYLKFPDLNWVMNGSSIRKDARDLILGDTVISNWSEQLAGVDYLWVSSADERFWSDYGESFSCSLEECRLHRLFKVDLRDPKPVAPAD